MEPREYRRRRDQDLQKREFLCKIAHRAEQLLTESSDPHQEMSWAENRLLQENLMGFDPSRKSRRSGRIKQ
jgi:hypothetical protein